MAGVIINKPEDWCQFATRLPWVEQHLSCRIDGWSVLVDVMDLWRVVADVDGLSVMVCLLLRMSCESGWLEARFILLNEGVSRLTTFD